MAKSGLVLRVRFYGTEPFEIIDHEDGRTIASYDELWQLENDEYFKPALGDMYIGKE